MLEISLFVIILLNISKYIYLIWKKLNVITIL